MVNFICIFPSFLHVCPGGWRWDRGSCGRETRCWACFSLNNILVRPDTRSFTKLVLLYFSWGEVVREHVMCVRMCLNSFRTSSYFTALSGDRWSKGFQSRGCGSALKLQCCVAACFFAYNAVRRYLDGQFHLHFSIISPCLSRRLTLRSRKLWKRNPMLSLFQPQQYFGETGHAVFHKTGIIYCISLEVKWWGNMSCACMCLNSFRTSSYFTALSGDRWSKGFQSRGRGSALKLQHCCCLWFFFWGVQCLVNVIFGRCFSSFHLSFSVVVRRGVLFFMHTYAQIHITHTHIKIYIYIHI